MPKHVIERNVPGAGKSVTAVRPVVESFTAE